MKYFTHTCKWCGSDNVSRTKKDIISSTECVIDYECKDCGCKFSVFYTFTHVEIDEKGASL